MAAPSADTCAASGLDQWSLVQWTMSDGTSGSSGCHGPILNAVWLHESGTPWFEIGIGDVTTEGGVQNVPFPLPICGGTPYLTIKNYVLATGATGPIDRGPYSPDFDNRAPIFFVEVHAAPGPDPAAACLEGVPWIPPRPDTGTWEVTRGGTWGDSVEIVVRDLEYDLPDGRRFTITEAIWNVTLDGTPIVIR